ncbi:molybdenum cofactor guanylyltransferase [Natronorubrum thiooxidans]|uniref:MobA-like NTP transferase domain-containing protein n=1 Tax=Natronorubrum thiooxidans TaxID=308853 RepID=A0A1N7H501_9EURY|nr:hypothetical protein [Natronorubrum thiooxidans]SIS19935.1 hypothetical protein SAMN05421752_12524 [Natronorubrum thiooxidans]
MNSHPHSSLRRNSQQSVVKNHHIMFAVIEGVDEQVLVLGCDFPLIQTSTLSCLLDRLENTAVVSAVDGRKPDCVLPLTDGQPQPLCGAYSVDALEAAIGALSNARNQSFGDVLDHLNVVPISHERLPGRSATFENVNIRDDLRTARASVQNERRNYRRH